MHTRRNRLLAAVLLAATHATFVTCSAESKILIPRGRSPIENGALSSELALIAMDEAQFLGQTPTGKAVFNVVANSNLSRFGTARAGAFTVQSARAASIRQETLITISYPSYAKPSRRKLREAGFHVVDDYPRGRFMVVRPIKRLASESVVKLARIRGISLASLTSGLSVNPPPRAEAIDAADISSAPAGQPLTNDPRSGDQWALRDIKADVAWKHATGAGSDVVVAVIDTGVDYTHPDLVDNMWINEAEIPNNGIDDDANGLVDDIHGADYIEDDGTPLDVDGHGTHVAGIIGAVGNNGQGIAGLNWQTRIMALRFMTSQPGQSATGNVTDAAKCIYYAIDHGADIINCSFSSPVQSEELERAIRRARDAGIIVVAAAGNTSRIGNDNDNLPNYPANYASFQYNYENVVSVAALNSRGDLTDFSHYGLRSVQLAAPGKTILSTMPGNDYEYSGGTSMAAPYVAGAFALMHGHRHYRHARWQQRVQSLLKYVQKRQSLDGRCVTGGSLDLNFFGMSVEEWFRDNDPTLKKDPEGLQSNPLSSRSAVPSGTYSFAGSGSARTSSQFAAPSISRSDSQTKSGPAKAEKYSAIPGQLLSDQAYRHRPLEVSNESDLATISFTLDRPAKILINASGSVRSSGDGFAIAHEFYDAEIPQDDSWSSSLRLVGLPEDRSIQPLATTQVMKLEKGKHSIRWRLRVPNGNKAQVLGGTGMTVLALPLSE